MSQHYRQTPTLQLSVFRFSGRAFIWGFMATSLAILAVFALSPRSVTAQALLNHNSNAPVDYAADMIELQDKQNRVILAGNVAVKQAGMNLNASRMTVSYRNNGGVQIRRIDATGGVVVTKGNERASGNSAIYDFDRRIITMLGNVALRQGGNSLNGNRLTIDLTTGRTTVDGRASSAPNADGTVSNGTGRVTGRFNVPQK